MSELSSTGDQMLVVLDRVALHGPLTVAQVAADCAINRTVAHRLLATLAKHHFVSRVKDGYVLGPHAFDLAAMAKPSLITKARPIMKRLAAMCKESVVLHAPLEREAVVLDQIVDESHLVVVRHTPGSHHPLRLGASGLAILTFLSPHEIAKILADRPEAEREALKPRLELIRAQGWALTQDELQEGVCGLAAPVFGAHDKCVGSLAFIVPYTRKDRLEVLYPELLGACSELTQAMLSTSSDQ